MTEVHEYKSENRYNDLRGNTSQLDNRFCNTNNEFTSYTYFLVCCWLCSLAHVLYSRSVSPLNGIVQHHLVCPYPCWHLFNQLCPLPHCQIVCRPQPVMKCPLACPTIYWVHFLCILVNDSGLVLYLEKDLDIGLGFVFWPYCTGYWDLKGMHLFGNRSYTGSVFMKRIFCAWEFTVCCVTDTVFYCVLLCWGDPFTCIHVLRSAQLLPILTCSAWPLPPCQLCFTITDTHLLFSAVTCTYLPSSATTGPHLLCCSNDLPQATAATFTHLPHSSSTPPHSPADRPPNFPTIKPSLQPSQPPQLPELCGNGLYSWPSSCPAKYPCTIFTQSDICLLHLLPFTHCLCVFQEPMRWTWTLSVFLLVPSMLPHYFFNKNKPLKT